MKLERSVLGCYIRKMILRQGPISNPLPPRVARTIKSGLGINFNTVYLYAIDSNCIKLVKLQEM